jgi:hypothetical protein
VWEKGKARHALAAAVEMASSCVLAAAYGEDASRGGLGQLKGSYAGWARQTENEVGWMGLKMALVLFLFLF